jgi:hypothetical protein
LDDLTIRARIRAMLETGELPCDEPETTWAGRGDGKRCVACREAIEPGAVEYETELRSGAVIRLHRTCHAIWEQECDEVADRPLP